MSNTLTKKDETCEARMKTIENKIPLNNIVMGFSSPLKKQLTKLMH